MGAKGSGVERGTVETALIFTSFGKKGKLSNAERERCRVQDLQWGKVVV